MPRSSSNFGGRFALLACVLALAVALVGCGGNAETTLDPAPAGSGSEFGLGPGVRPMSSGPGYKGSPVWSRDGRRIAFTIDGYVADRPGSAGERRLWTPRDFGARTVLWDSGKGVGILGSTTDEDNEGTSNSGGETGPLTLYRSRYTEDSPDITEVASGVFSAVRLGFGESVICAVENDSSGSDLILIRGGRVVSTYGEVEGEVGGISLSPDGEQVALAVRPSGGSGGYEVRTMDLSDGSSRAIARLDEGARVFGAPQWTKNGVYYVAGAEENVGDGGALYKLYRASPQNPEAPELAPGVGGDFTASSVRVSPDGEKLAVVGRLRPSSPTNLHVLDLEGRELRPLTNNEDMEIRGGSDDLSWSPDGRSVAIVARGAFSGPRVRPVPPDALLEEFFNVYEVPLDGGGA